MSGSDASKNTDFFSLNVAKQQTKFDFEFDGNDMF